MKRIVFAVLTALFSTVALANWKPSKPVEVVYGVNPGSGNERTFRILGDQLEKEGVVSFAPKHLPGAQSVVGTNYFVKQNNDGHVIQVISIDATFIVSEMFNKKAMKYTPDDFTPIMGIGTSAFVLIANPSIPVKNFQEFVDYFKENSSRVTIGIGTSGQAPGEDMFKRIGVKDHKAKLVVYKSGSQAAVDVAGGHIPFALLSASIPYQFYKDGKVKYIAQTGNKPLAGIPEVPLAKNVLPGYAHDVHWGIMLPKGAKQEIVDWYVENFKRVLSTSETTEKQKDQLITFDPQLISPSAWKSEILRQRREAGIK